MFAKLRIPALLAVVSLCVVSLQTSAYGQNQQEDDEEEVAAKYEGAATYTIRDGNIGINWMIEGGELEEILFKPASAGKNAKACSAAALKQLMEDSLLKDERKTVGTTVAPYEALIKVITDNDINGKIYAEFNDCAPTLDFYHGILCVDVLDKADEINYNACTYVTEALPNGKN